MIQKVDATIPFASQSKPKHIAIIMDGNNRWAKERHLPGAAGHKAGVEAVRSVVKACIDQGVEILTLFAFSSENWRRPEQEVSALMKLFLFALQREVKKLHKNNIRLQIIGDRSRFNPVLQAHMEDAEALTADNTKMRLVVAANYGGHWDIAQACQKIALLVEQGELKASEVDDNLIQSFICLGDVPMPDLCIRTASEKRISNFMLWQLAYTEFYFSDVYWPDFKEEQLIEAIEDFGHRKRRFGQTDDQVH
jgi:undecaprenyl diphosphate synthase